MSHLQHERIVALARELRLGALPDLYDPIAQTAAKKKDASCAAILEEVLRAEREARRVRGTRRARSFAQEESATSRTPRQPRNPVLPRFNFAPARSATP